MRDFSTSFCLLDGLVVVVPVLPDGEGGRDVNARPQKHAVVLASRTYIPNNSLVQFQIITEHRF